jgi:hypothetical protein
MALGGIAFELELDLGMSEGLPGDRLHDLPAVHVKVNVPLSRPAK